MSRCRRVLAVASLSASGCLGACASAPPEWEGLSAPDMYSSALTVLAEGNHASGRAGLARVLELCGTTALGERAMVALIVDALDPREPDPDLAAGLSRAYREQPYRTQWAEQIAASVYLVSLNLGGSSHAEGIRLTSMDPGEFPAVCRQISPSPTGRDAAPLPQLPSRSMADRLIELQETVEELQAELTRVQETLRP